MHISQFVTSQPVNRKLQILLGLVDTPVDNQSSSYFRVRLRTLIYNNFKLTPCPVNTAYQRWEIVRLREVSLNFSLMIRDKNPRFRVDCLREKIIFSVAQQTIKKQNWHFVLNVLCWQSLVAVSYCTTSLFATGLIQAVIFLNSSAFSKRQKAAKKLRMRTISDKGFRSTGFLEITLHFST